MPAPTGKAAGWEYSVYIDGVAYGARKFSYKPAVADLDVTDSESPSSIDADLVYNESLYGVGKVTFTIEAATFNPDDNPYATPRLLRVGTYHDFEIEPRAGGDRHTFQGLILSPAHEGEVTGLQPFTIEGVSNGIFVSAGEAAE